MLLVVTSSSVVCSGWWNTHVPQARRQGHRPGTSPIAWDVSEKLLQDAKLQLNRMWSQGCALPLLQKPYLLTFPGAVPSFLRNRVVGSWHIPFLHSSKLTKGWGMPAGYLLTSEPAVLSNHRSVHKTRQVCNGDASLRASAGQAVHRHLCNLRTGCSTVKTWVWMTIAITILKYAPKK